MFNEEEKNSQLQETMLVQRQLQIISLSIRVLTSGRITYFRRKASKLKQKHQFEHLVLQKQPTKTTEAYKPLGQKNFGMKFREQIENLVRKFGLMNPTDQPMKTTVIRKMPSRQSR